MLRHVALVKTDPSEECSPSIIRVTRIIVFRLLVTAKIVPSSPILVTLMTDEIRSSKRRLLQEPRDVITQKPALFIVSVVKNSNLTLFSTMTTQVLFSWREADALGNITFV
jgi:hypothetical protein